MGAAAYNWAQNQLDFSFHAFQDSRGVTVLSPDANFAKDFTDRTAVKIRFGVDAAHQRADAARHHRHDELQHTGLGVAVLACDVQARDDAAVVRAVRVTARARVGRR